MTELAKKSNSDIEKLLREKREVLREFRFKSAGSHVRNVREGANTRKEIARLLTERNSRSKVGN